MNCHQLYEDSLLTDAIVVRDGTAVVPNSPGLGYELDLDAVARLRVEKPRKRPDPPRLLETTWPDGRRMLLGSHGVYNCLLAQANRGNIPYFERGVTTRLIPNDGSAQWQDWYDRSGPDNPLFL